MLFIKHSTQGFVMFGDTGTLYNHLSVIVELERANIKAFRFLFFIFDLFYFLLCRMFSSCVMINIWIAEVYILQGLLGYRILVYPALGILFTVFVLVTETLCRALNVFRPFQPSLVNFVDQNFLICFSLSSISFLVDVLLAIVPFDHSSNRNRYL